MIAAGEVEAAALVLVGIAAAAAVGVRADHGVVQEIELCVVPRSGVDSAWDARRR